MKKRMVVLLGLVAMMALAVPTSAVAEAPGGRSTGRAPVRSVSHMKPGRGASLAICSSPLSPRARSREPHLRRGHRTWRILFMPVATSEGLVVHCDVPAHRPLLVSPGGQFATLGLDSDTRKGIVAIVEEFMAMTHDAVVKVDGERVPRINRFQTASWVGLDLGSDNLFGVPAGTYHMYLAGWFVMVRGLDPGRHTIWLGDVFTDTTHTDQVATIKFILNVG